jgi:hypothetical protein
MVGKHPARIPDLTDWKRDISDSTSAENLSTQLMGLKQKSRANKGIIDAWKAFHVKA